MTPTEIKTNKSGLILKQISLADVAPYFALLESSKQHFSTFGGTSETGYRSRKEIASSVIHPNNPKKLRFGVWNGKKLVGVFSLVLKGNKRGEVGGWIGNKFTRKGYASHAIMALARHSQAEYGCTRIIATTNPENTSSQQMLKKCGFVAVRKLKNRNYYVYF